MIVAEIVSCFVDQWLIKLFRWAICPSDIEIDCDWLLDKQSMFADWLFIATKVYHKLKVYLVFYSYCQVYSFEKITNSAFSPGTHILLFFIIFLEGARSFKTRFWYIILREKRLLWKSGDPRPIFTSPNDISLIFLCFSTWLSIFKK